MTHIEHFSVFPRSTPEGKTEHQMKKRIAVPIRTTIRND